MNVKPFRVLLSLIYYHILLYAILISYLCVRKVITHFYAINLKLTNQGRNKFECGGGTLSIIDLSSLLFDSVQFIVHFTVKLSKVAKLKLGFLRAFDIRIFTRDQNRFCILTEN